MTREQYRQRRLFRLSILLVAAVMALAFAAIAYATEENRLRVGCCILGQHIKNEGSVRASLCRYSNDYEGWYADSVMKKMGEFM